VKSAGILQDSMKVYKRETQEVIKRFLGHRISFPACVAALDAAFADLVPRLTAEQFALFAF
jgi:hypothetical protein